MCNTLDIIAHRKRGYQCIVATQTMPAGRLDRLLDALISEKPNRRTLLRLLSSGRDEIVIARDRRNRERIEIRPFTDGGYRLSLVPHVFKVARREGTWKLSSKYGLLENSEPLGSLHWAATQLVRSLSDLDADPLAHRPRGPFCLICGRHLTDNTSVGVGIGPECGDRYHWLFDRREVTTAARGAHENAP